MSIMGYIITVINEVPMGELVTLTLVLSKTDDKSLFMHILNNLNTYLQFDPNLLKIFVDTGILDVLFAQFQKILLDPNSHTIKTFQPLINLLLIFLKNNNEALELFFTQNALNNLLSILTRFSYLRKSVFNFFFTFFISCGEEKSIKVMQSLMGTIKEIQNLITDKTSEYKDPKECRHIYYEFLDFIGRLLMRDPLLVQKIFENYNLAELFMFYFENINFPTNTAEKKIEYGHTLQNTVKMSISPREENHTPLQGSPTQVKCEDDLKLTYSASVKSPPMEPIRGYLWSYHNQNLLKLGLDLIQLLFSRVQIFREVFYKEKYFKRIFQQILNLGILQSTWGKDTLEILFKFILGKLSESASDMEYKLEEMNSREQEYSNIVILHPLILNILINTLFKSTSLDIQRKYINIITGILKNSEQARKCTSATGLLSSILSTYEGELKIESHYLHRSLHQIISVCVCSYPNPHSIKLFMVYILQGVNKCKGNIEGEGNLEYSPHPNKAVEILETLKAHQITSDLPTGVIFYPYIRTLTPQRLILPYVNRGGYASNISNNNNRSFSYIIWLKISKCEINQSESKDPRQPPVLGGGVGRSSTMGRMSTMSSSHHTHNYSYARPSTLYSQTASTQSSDVPFYLLSMRSRDDKSTFDLFIRQNRLFIQSPHGGICQFRTLNFDAYLGTLISIGIVYTPSTNTNTNTNINKKSKHSSQPPTPSSLSKIYLYINGIGIEEREFEVFGGLEYAQIPNIGAKNKGVFGRGENKVKDEWGMEGTQWAAEERERRKTHALIGYADNIPHPSYICEVLSASYILDQLSSHLINIIYMGSIHSSGIYIYIYIHSI